MSMSFINQPKYFYFAQTLVNYFINHISQTHQSKGRFALADIYQIFGQDFAATTANLEGILNIADNYAVQSSLDHQNTAKLIDRYHIDAIANQLEVSFNAQAVDAIQRSYTLLPPDPTQYD